MKKKRNIFQSLSKDIFKGFKRLYFYSYTSLKYLNLTLRFKLSKKKLISLIFQFYYQQENVQKNLKEC